MLALVTGGCGFIGSKLVKRLVATGHQVRIIDNLSTGKISNIIDIKGVGLFQPRDIRDSLDDVFEGVDVVFHLAALKSVQESIEKPYLYQEVNVDGTVRLLKYASQYGVKQFIFSSSSAVYGDNKVLPLHTSLVCNPLSPYGKTKDEGELYVTLHGKIEGLKVKCLRYFNVYGPGQSLDDNYAAVIPIFINKALKGEPLMIYGDGTQSRDFIHVEDVVNANLMALNVPNGVYNVGTGTPITIKDLAIKIINMTGNKSSILYTDKRPGDIMYSYPSKDCLPGQTYGFDYGLMDTICYFRNLK